MKWISVEDRLPLDDTLTIVYESISKNVGEGLFYLGEWELWGGVFGNITHWQPLPEPPEEGK